MYCADARGSAAIRACRAAPGHASPGKSTAISGAIASRAPKAIGHLPTAPCAPRAVPSNSSAASRALPCRPAKSWNADAGYASARSCRQLGAPGRYRATCFGFVESRRMTKAGDRAQRRHLPLAPAFYGRRCFVANISDCAPRTINSGCFAKRVERWPHVDSRLAPGQTKWVPRSACHSQQLSALPVSAGGCGEPSAASHECRKCGKTAALRSAVWRAACNQVGWLGALPT